MPKKYPSKSIQIATISMLALIAANKALLVKCYQNQQKSLFEIINTEKENAYLPKPQL